MTFDQHGTQVQIDKFKYTIKNKITSEFENNHEEFLFEERDWQLKLGWESEI